MTTQVKKFRVSLLRMTILTALLATGVLSSCKKGNPAQPAATTTQFSGTFSGNTEVPAVSTRASGTVTANYNSSTKVLSYQLSWTGLGTAPSGMHFHVGAAGTNGPILITISGFAAQTYGSISGQSAALKATEEADLMAGNFYANIHTSANPNGEIRAQLIKK